MKKENPHTDISIECGKTTDSFNKLEMLCKKEAKKLSETIEIPNLEVISVTFLTSDIPEVICVGGFSRSESGLIVYELDFSQSTL
ncbi:MAG: hypothetical protein FWF52_01445 [Candidatus Azobacteroides sp.]|nr:hypothetical protein [Candidatus Azobacteroides sp.]